MSVYDGFWRVLSTNTVLACMIVMGHLFLSLKCTKRCVLSMDFTKVGMKFACTPSVW